MLRGSIARRYAEAVFQIGVENNTVDRWRDDLRTIAEYYGNKRLLFVLSEPKIPAQRKEQVVRDLLADKVQPEALNLALLLVERELAPLAPAISQAFDQRYNDYKGIAVAQVTTAIPLDESLRTQIRQQLSQLTGKQIQMQERVSPDILGGAIARVGDTLIDGSLRRRFELLRQQIASGGVGGPDDGLLATVLGPGGAGGPDGAGGAAPPFVVAPADTGSGGVPGEPSGNGGSAPGSTPSGPASSTEMAPRSSSASAHLGPRPQQQQRPKQPPQRAGGQSNPNAGGNRSGGRNKRRRR